MQIWEKILNLVYTCTMYVYIIRISRDTFLSISFSLWNSIHYLKSYFWVVQFSLENSTYTTKKKVQNQAERIYICISNFLYQFRNAYTHESEFKCGETNPIKIPLSCLYRFMHLWIDAWRIAMDKRTFPTTMMMNTYQFPMTMGASLVIFIFLFFVSLSSIYRLLIFHTWLTIKIHWIIRFSVSKCECNTIIILLLLIDSKLKVY